MFINFLNNILKTNRIWIIITAIASILLLFPLLSGHFYVPIFDNLDSNVVWYKILAESGAIFSSNETIIPNMLNGIPRASYPNEFNIILWLYYFFTPKTAFIINEILIHIVAFFSMWVLLQKYFLANKEYSSNILIFAGSIYFSFMPYWSGAGLTIAILPLVTYSLLNIKKNASNVYDWILLILLPLYTSFIFYYMYYISLLGLYILYDALKEKRLNYRLLAAVFLMGIVFLASEYRLVMSMFFNNQYISHREEFNIYFDQSLLNSYRTSLVFFLDGHTSHVNPLQGFYILPTIIVSMFLSLLNRRLTSKESIVIYAIIFIGYIIDIWTLILTQLYTLPLFLLLSLYIYVFKRNYRIFALLLISLVLLAFYNGLSDCTCLSFLLEVFPIFKTLSLIRLSFILPFIYAITFVFSLHIISRKLYYSNIYITIIILLQIHISLFFSFYQNSYRDKYASFEQYYAPKLFNSIKNFLQEPLDSIKIISYGIEPAVTQYNGFHTLDGYIINYPLQYKHDFRKVIEPYLNKKESYASKMAVDIYDNWGSKVYILSTVSTLHFYKKNITVKNMQFDINAICELGADYMFSTRMFLNPAEKQLKYMKRFTGQENSWDIYLYKINCN